MVIASNGEEAINIIAQEPFDVVFLDIVMPGMDGLEAFKAIKEINPEAIVIMMSGFPVEDEIREAMNLGATDHIKKPFDVNEVLTITQVARYLNVRKLTVYKLAREGGLPAFKVGGQWRFKKELLDKWIAQETKRVKPFYRTYPNMPKGIFGVCFLLQRHMTRTPPAFLRKQEGGAPPEVSPQA